MLVHIYTKMGKCHCVNVTGTIALWDTGFYMMCSNSTYELIKHEEPCCIRLMDTVNEITLHDCTINDNKTITYASKHIIGRSDK